MDVGQDPQSTVGSDAEIDLAGICSVFARWKFLFFGIVAISLACAVVVSKFGTKIYKGEALLQVGMEESQMPPLSDVLGRFDEERIAALLPEGSAWVTQLDVLPYGETKNTVRLLMYARNRERIVPLFEQLRMRLKASPEFAPFMTQIEFRKKTLSKEIQELDAGLAEMRRIEAACDNLIRQGRLIDIKFSPVEVKDKIRQWSGIDDEKKMQLAALGDLSYVAPPVISPRPVRPRLKWNLALGVILGSLIGAFSVFCADGITRMRSRRRGV